MSDVIPPARLSFLLARALHLAIRTLEALPPKQRPVSDIADMRRLLARFGPMGEAVAFSDEVQAYFAGLENDAATSEEAER